MWKAGLTDYADFAQRLLERITKHPISFEVFADDADEIRRQARMIAGWGDNVYVKIPVTTTSGESLAPLVRELSEDGVKVNVTALFTTAQVELITAAVATARRPTSRCSPAGSPTPASTRCRSWRASVEIMLAAPRSELIWASPREVLNVVQADQIGCHIITMTHDLLEEARLARQGPRPVLAGDRPDVPPRRHRRRLHALTSMKRALHHRRSRVHRQHARRPPAPRTASRSSSSTTSAPAGASSSRSSSSARARRLVEGDVLDQALLEEAIAGCDTVFHLQANADVRHGLEHPRRDLEQNTIATSNVLEAMRAVGTTDDRVLLDRLGLRRARGLPDARGRAVPGPDVALRRVQARRRGHDRRLLPTATGSPGSIFRFVSILGERYTHGHVFDFYRALKRDPTRLRVLGDGRQEKSYLYVQDCVDGDAHGGRRARRRLPGDATSTTSAPTRRSSSTTRSR